MPPSSKNEVALLEQYNKEIETLGDQLADSDPQTAKGLQRQIDQKLQIYWKQVQLVKTQYPDVVDGMVHESAYYTFQALRKLLDAGMMRRVSSRSGNMALGIATGLVAKQQEKNNAHQALTILDQALAIFDYPGAHLQKAMIFRMLSQKDKALQELNYIIQNFQDDDSYLSARQMKDEIENPPKKGMCFVATATYGTAMAPEVIALSRFRDEVLLSSFPGKLFVRLYYLLSPPCAEVIAKSSHLRFVVRLLLLQPALTLVHAWTSTTIDIIKRRNNVADEVYYCGHCRRQQQPSQGERCKVCGRITVSWDTSRESEEDAKRKWRHING